MRYAIYGLALILAGCVSSRPVALPNGTQGFDVRCPGHHRDVSDCMNEAARVCGGKYQIWQQDKDSGATVMVPAGNGFVAGTGIHRSMIVSCGGG